MFVFTQREVQVAMLFLVTKKQPLFLLFVAQVMGAWHPLFPPKLA